MIIYTADLSPEQIILFVSLFYKLVIANKSEIKINPIVGYYSYQINIKTSEESLLTFEFEKGKLTDWNKEFKKCVY